MPGAHSIDLPAAVPSVTPGIGLLTSVLKRDGRTVVFDRERLVRAIEMAFRAEHGTPYPDPLALVICDQVEEVTDAVIAALAGPPFAGETVEIVEIERIQDEVERQLMAHEHFGVARRYILYREARAQRRGGRRLRIRDPRHGETILEASVVRAMITEAATDLGSVIDLDALFADTLASTFDGITLAELSK